MSAGNPPMGELTKRLEAVKLAPKKKDAGTAGQKIELQTNLSLLSIKPNIPYYKYDVHMVVHFGNERSKELTKITREDFPEQSRKAISVAIYKRLLKNEEHSKFFGKERTVFYDRAKILFSTTNLPVGSDGRKVIMLPGNFFESPELTGVEKYEVVISKVKDSFQANSNDLLRTDTEDKSLMEVLQILLGQNAMMDGSHFISYGNGTHYLYDPSKAGFTERDIPDLGNSKYVGIGAQLSTKCLEGPDGKGAGYVGLDIRKSAFHNDDQSLLEKLRSLSMFLDRGRSNFTIDAAIRRKDAILPELKDLYVYTTYGQKKQTFPIANFGGSANRETVELDGASLTVTQYFKKRYGITLQNPDLFLVISRGPRRVFPIELLRVSPNQRVSHKQETPDQTAALIKGCAILPEARLRQSRNLKNGLHLKENDPVLNAAGVKVANDFVKVPGRQIPAPRIFGAKNMLIATNNGKFNVSHFAQPAKIVSWMVVGLFLSGDKEFELKRFQQEIAKEMRACGMFAPEPVKIDCCTQPDRATVDKIMNEASSAKIQFVFSVSSDATKLHDYFKTKEASFGNVITQNVRVSVATNVLVKHQRQTLHNIVMKTNEKLGGLCHMVQDDKKLMDDDSRMIIAFDISNPPSENQMDQKSIGVDDAHRMPSVIGFSVYMSKIKQADVGGYKYVDARQSDMFGESVHEIAIDCVMQFRKNRNIIRKHLVFLFNGIPEAQYENLIVNRYMKDLGDAIVARLSPAFNPHISCIAVTKQHNERLFASSFSGKSAPEQNIDPGTVVDRVIVSKRFPEFYLNAHITLQGTAKTPKYSIVLDSTNHTMDEWQQLMYNLCYRHGIIGSPISIPAPLYHAGDYAKRGHNVWLASMQPGVEMTINEANEALTHKGKLISTTRVNA